MFKLKVVCPVILNKFVCIILSTIIIFSQCNDEPFEILILWSKISKKSQNYLNIEGYNLVKLFWQIDLFLLRPKYNFKEKVII